MLRGAVVEPSQDALHKPNTTLYDYNPVPNPSGQFQLFMARQSFPALPTAITHSCR